MFFGAYECELALWAKQHTVSLCEQQSLKFTPVSHPFPRNVHGFDVYLLGERGDAVVTKPASVELLSGLLITGDHIVTGIHADTSEQAISQLNKLLPA